LRRLAEDKAECREFFHLSLEQQSRRQRNPPPEWDDEAKKALSCIQLLPPNMASFKLSDKESDELKRKPSDALEEKTSMLICIPNGDMVVQEAAEMLFNAKRYTIKQLAIPLLLVSGRRSAEVLNMRSLFARREDSQFHALFSGQLKKKGKAEDYVIPLLVSFDIFAYGLAVLRDKQAAENVPAAQLSDEDVHSRYQRRVAGELDERGGTGFLPSLPAADVTGKKHLTPHSLRSIYAALVMGMFVCPYTFPQVAKLILGHETVAESLHYQVVQVLPCAMRNGPLLID
jgi:integrase